MKHHWLLILAIAAFSAGVHANSYVGNGGSQGDIEMQVTLKQLQETFQAIVNRTDNKVPLCRCNGTYKGRSICEPLKALDDKQADYCSDSLYKVAPQVLAVLKKGDIHINWTNSAMDVKDGEEVRAVDAVADRSKHQITVNQPRFLGMSQIERVFLLSHEFMHFASLEGKPLTDRGVIGPFKEEDGQHVLVNAMAASASTLQGDYPREIKARRAALHRSQSLKHIWFSVDGGAAQTQSNYSDDFQFNQFTRLGVTARYQWTNWGVALNYRGERGDKKVLDTIAVSENVQIAGAGVTYRIFPFSDPLTFWGQSHVLLQGMVEYVKADYNYSQDPIFRENTATTWGGSFQANYYLPIFFGFWGYVGLGYEVHPYSHTETVNGIETKLNYDSNLFSQWIGVAYAF